MGDIMKENIALANFMGLVLYKLVTERGLVYLNEENSWRVCISMLNSEKSSHRLEFLKTNALFMENTVFRLKMAIMQYLAVNLTTMEQCRSNFV